MENNIKRAMDEIDVPLDKLDQAVERGINIKTKKRKNPFIIAAISLAATGALILGSGFISPKVANVLADVPLIGFMYDIEKHDEGLSVALSDENKVVLNETVTSNGVSITIEEIVYDGNRMNVIFSMPTYEDVYPLTILVDGERVNTGESLRTLDEGEVYRGLWEINATEDMPDTFDLTIKIHQIGETKGEWTFSTPITKVNNNSVSLQAGQTGRIDGLSYTVESALMSTTSTEIVVAFDKKQYMLFSEGQMLGVTITDQTGTPLQKLDERGSGDDNKMVYTYLVEPLSEDVTEIKLMHYFMVVSTFIEREEITVELADTFPQVISQGEMGDMVITNMEQNGQQVTLTFHSTSEFAFSHSFTPNNMTVTNEAGESLMIEYPKAIGSNEYQIVFQSTPGKKLIQTTTTPKMEIEPSAIVTIPVR